MVDVSAEQIAENTAVVALVGAVDDSVVAGYRASVEQLLSAPSLELLIVDLGRTEFLDSSGLGLLVEINSRLRELGIALQFRAVPPRVQQLLRRTGLVDLLPIVD